mmetsp:Transcript_119040/g.332145  ORF Transcript_119040/g.332145 Transcript_119040/m.332145 type:complete len:215 (-) Transcript_119040:124-768(-)
MASKRTESCSSLASFSKDSMSSVSMDSFMRTPATPPRALAAWRRTMGVSSEHSLEYSFSKSSCLVSPTFGSAAAKRLQTEILEENQSCSESRLMRAKKCRETWSEDMFLASALSDSTAFSRTEISSTLHSSSRGPKSACECARPPTQATPWASCSASVMSTSSSSSMMSCRKGMSSSRVRSGPRAVAMVPRFLIEFKRSWMSSCLSSSISTATG